ncbi:putative RNA-directed DNA polymerase [Tanacetum coccineum]|uniref:RNA-directed DNA polymerase n=1 Tax=Tanacetum coccineum TaxID=301880 RepID=A0ABQ5BV67_9ASTR
MAVFRLQSLLSNAKQLIKLNGKQQRDVPKGYLAVYVGEVQGKRFVVPLSYLDQPLFQDLLRRSEEQFGQKLHFSSVEVESRITPVKSLADIEYGKVKDLKQKAKTRWALEGDENTKIKDAVWGYGSDEAPGPDGFTFKFIKKHWDLLENDIISYVKDFETSFYIPRGCNSSFITLVPKLEDPLFIGDYRPISLIGCQYKIIAKVLANRLSKVISSVVGEVQMDFIKGRQIIDGPLMVDEIISWAKKQKKKFVFLKVDFEKAFDSLSWSFLFSIMKQMGFSDKWRDPFSPFLFILEATTLNVAILEATHHNIFRGIKVGKDKLNISHLQFADDGLILGEWSLTNAKNLSRILTCFHLASGLKVNFSKSKLYGIGANMSRCVNWTPVINRFQKRLSNWKAKILSFGGRLTLVKYVVGSLGVYYFSNFKAPKKIIKKLESIRRKFFWGGNSDENKISWIAWDKIISPRHKGGLGIDDAAILAGRVLILPKLKKAFDVAVNTTLWHLWNFKNNAIFSPKCPRKELLLNDIKLSSFTWFLSRNRKVSINWMECVVKLPGWEIGFKEWDDLGALWSLGPSRNYSHVEPSRAVSLED